jgi:hypothetical protein
MIFIPSIILVPVYCKFNGGRNFLVDLGTDQFGSELIQNLLKDKIIITINVQT